MIVGGTTRILLRFSLCLSVFVCATAVALPAGAVTQNGAIGVNGTVAGPPPSAPPTIDSPVDASTTTQKNIAVEGTCQSSLLVKLFRNAVFAGSAACASNGHYTLNIDAVEGRNDLIAPQYDTLDQSSPDSDTITVYYVPPAQQPVLPPVAGSEQVAGFQLVIDYDYNFGNIIVGQPVHLPIHFIGGAPPYAVSVSWGDGTSSLISRQTTEQFFVDHVFKTPGTYTVKISVSDTSGTVAYLEFVMQVSGVGQVSFLGLPIADTLQQGLIPALTWQTIIFMVAAFSLGLVVAKLWPSLIKAIARSIKKSK